MKATFGQDELTGDDWSICEVGIFDAAADGVLGRRWVLDTPIPKDNIDELEIECAITIVHGEVPGFDVVGAAEGLADQFACGYWNL